MTPDEDQQAVEVATDDDVVAPADGSAGVAEDEEDPVLYYVDAARELVRRAGSGSFEADLHAVFERELRAGAITRDTFDQLEQRLRDLLGPGSTDVVDFLLTGITVDDEEAELPALYGVLTEKERLDLQRFLRRLRGLYGPEVRSASQRQGELPEDWIGLNARASILYVLGRPQLVHEVQITRTDGQEFMLRFRGGSFFRFTEYTLRTLNAAFPQATELVDLQDVSALVGRVEELVDAVSPATEPMAEDGSAAIGAGDPAAPADAAE
jgi:hypothetical protein